MYNLACYEDSISGFHLRRKSVGRQAILGKIVPFVAARNHPRRTVVRGEARQGHDEVYTSFRRLWPAVGQDGKLPLVAMQRLSRGAGSYIDGAWTRRRVPRQRESGQR